VHSALEFVVHNAPGLSVIIAALVLIFGVFSYTKQNALRRFEAFEKLRQLARTDEEIKEVIDCIRNEETAKLVSIEKRKKLKVLSYYEQIALMHESGLITTSVAHYMFGFYCVRCLESKEFWKNIEDHKYDYYWSLFIRFANLMQELEREKLNEHAKLDDVEKLQLRLPRRPSFAFWSRRSQFRF
jgi:hypothetical protein